MISLVKTEKTKLEGIERELPVFAVGETHHLIMGGGIQGKWSGSLSINSVGSPTRCVMPIDNISVALGFDSVP